MSGRIVILGDGISGNSLALALARQGRESAILARATACSEPPPVGEHLAPEALPLLQSLGLLDVGFDPAHLRSPGVVSLWGGSKTESSYTLRPGGDGMNLDRAVFDAALRKAAAEAGASRLMVARLDSIERTGDRWRFQIDQNGQTRTVDSPLIIDATGRAAALARRMGARLHSAGRLVGLVARFDGPDSGDRRLLVEAVADGWWYALRQTGRRRIAVYLTDADLLPNGAAHRAQVWREAFARSSLVKGFGPADPKSVDMVDARSLRLVPSAGPGWIAVGDAAMAFDPLSAAGITKALADARATAASILDNSYGDAAGWEPLIADRQRRWSRYVSEHAKAYAAAGLRGPFWDRRGATNPLTP